MVTLAFGELDAPTLATVVILSEQPDEDSKSWARALVDHSGPSHASRRSSVIDRVKIG